MSIARRGKGPFVTGIIVAILVASMLASPASATLSKTFGQILDKPTSTTDLTEVSFLAAAVFTGGAKTPAHIMVGDANTDDAVQTDEAWYVDLDGSGAVSVGDLRLTTVGSFQAFSRVESGHTDVTTDLDAAGGLCYVESQVTNHPAGSYTPGFQGTPTASAEAMYVDISGACGNVAQNDVRITQTPSFVSGGGAPGSRVQAGGETNATVAVTTSHAAVTFRAYDLDNSGTYTLPDALYLDVDNSGTATFGDVRMTAWGSFQAGSVVQAGDADVTTALEQYGGTEPTFIFVDSNIDGSFTCASETLYIDADASGSVNNLDYRVNAFSSGGTSFQAGTQVRTGNADITGTVVAANARIKYHDANIDNVFNYGDGLYMDADNSNTITAGDLRINQAGSNSAVTCVAAGATDINLNLITTALTIRIRFLDSDASNSLSVGDLPYFELDTAGTLSNAVTPGDIRLSSVYSTYGSVGTVSDDDDADRRNVLQAHGTAPTIRFVDDNNDGNYNANEGIYISMKSQATVQAGDVRFSGFSTFSAGTQVTSTDSDRGNALIALGAAVLRYVESGNNANFDPADFVYVDSDASAQVNVGDLRLQSRGGGSPGSKVASGNSDISETLNNLPVAFAAAQILVLKAVPSTASQFSAGYVTGDLVIYDTDNNGLPTIGDIILVGSGGATGSTGTSGGGGGTPPPATQTPTPTAAFSLTKDPDESLRRITVNAAGSTAPSGRTISTYSWNWGDGTTGTGVQNTHSYSADGTYTVSLTVTDSSGQTGTLSRIVTFGEPTTTTTPTETAETTEPTATNNTTATTGDGVDTPGLGFALVAGGLAIAALAVRRRRP